MTRSQQHTMHAVTLRHPDRPAEYPGLWRMVALAERLGLRDTRDAVALRLSDMADAVGEQQANSLVNSVDCRYNEERDEACGNTPSTLTNEPVEEVSMASPILSDSSEFSSPGETATEGR